MNWTEQQNAAFRQLRAAAQGMVQKPTIEPPIWSVLTKNSSVQILFKVQGEALIYGIEIRPDGSFDRVGKGGVELTPNELLEDLWQAAIESPPGF